MECVRTLNQERKQLKPEMETATSLLSISPQAAGADTGESFAWIFHFLTTKLFFSDLSELEKLLTKLLCDLDVTVQQINDQRPLLQMTKSGIPIEEPHVTRSLIWMLRLIRPLPAVRVSVCRIHLMPTNIWRMSQSAICLRIHGIYSLVVWTRKAPMNRWRDISSNGVKLLISLWVKIP